MNLLALVLFARSFERLLLLLTCWRLAHCLLSRQEMSRGRQLLSRPVGGGLGTSFGALASLWGARTLLSSRPLAELLDYRTAQILAFLRTCAGGIVSRRRPMAANLSVDADAKWSTDEQRLLRYLLRGYDPAVRPVRNSSSVVVVEFGLNLIQIVDMVCRPATARPRT